ncbi:glycoside hydrolase family 32 protein [Arthrobacter sp. ISL-48]|uniref:glycoside hydrolase family 32 protein n=1 Tax=Arthrobacter sp. ISL-48 TaxID=2819110 RepID=UPI001BEA23FC|nr:glycoside hydrolase family 32 protein [Arthrobacter sp. ISL-48]MBT2534207.1 glycoside hydrolase family 32 protein [Arthrobacter sp. ISL-48]
MKSITGLDVPYRPEWHYSAERNWLNDPNGLVYSNGTYHLFYQHNPHGNDWGNMSWGHATSENLLQWEEGPVAILCDEQESIFSGSAVVDHHNTSGFGIGGVPPLVAIYTSAYSPESPLAGRQAQSLAYSTDDGDTWTKYAGNPVLDRASSDFRDPKVFWHEGDAGCYWVMVAVEALNREVVLYRSEDLKSWEYLSTFGPANATEGLWECPDLFELPLDGDASDTRWVMVVSLSPGGIAGGSGSQYFIGTFDGVTFRSETTVTEGMQPDNSRMTDYRWLDWGRDYYAAVSFSNVPDGRRLMIGWMSNWQYAGSTPSDGWRSAMSLAREVRLISRGGRPVLVQEAMDPLGQQGGQSTAPFTLDRQPLAEGVAWLPADASGDVLRIDAEFEPGAAATVGLVLRAGSEAGGAPGGASGHEDPAGLRTVLAYECISGELSLDRTQSGNVGFHETFPSVERVAVPLEDGRLRLRIFLDRCSVEVFAQDGLATITDLIFPDQPGNAVGLLAEGGGTLVSLAVVR